MRIFRIKHWLKTSLWVVPFLFILGGIALAFTAITIDPAGELVPPAISGDETAAMQMLYLIAFAMLTLTGLVLSLVVLIVQLAMGTFSPRIVRQILQDRPSQCAIGLFAGTFSYSLLCMRAIDTTPDGGTVPGLAVVGAMILVLSCIMTLVWYVNHVGQMLRVAALVGSVANDTMSTLEQIYPDHGPQETDEDLVFTSKGGIVFEVDHDQLVAVAKRSDCCLELLWAVGDFVPTGAALARVVGDPEMLSHTEVTDAVALGPERTMNQDVAYGLRMLVDIAIGSLSSGPFDDPTTAVQTIDRLHDILRQIVRRPMSSGEFRDDDGALRLLVPTLQWNGFVRLAFDEIRQAGAGSPQVSRRLQSALEDLLTVAPPERRAALEDQMELLSDVVVASIRHEADQRAALVPDPSGIGSADELTAADHGQAR